MLADSHVKMIDYIMLLVYTQSVIIIGHLLLKIDIVISICVKRHIKPAS